MTARQSSILRRTPAVLLIAVTAIVLAATPEAEAQSPADSFGCAAKVTCPGDDPEPEDETPDEETPEEAPVPTPEPTPTPDPLEDEARALAKLQRAAPITLGGPTWEIWPSHADPQVVALETWLHIHADPSSAVLPATTHGSVTVTAVAAPLRSEWRFSDQNGVEIDTVTCQGPTSAYIEDASPLCGKTWHHSSAVHGVVTMEVQVHYAVSWTSSLGNSGSFEMACSEGTPGLLLVNEILSYGAADGQRAVDDWQAPSNVPRGPVQRPGTCGTVPGERGLPVSTAICEFFVEGTGGALGENASLGAGGEARIERFSDGTQLVTISADAGASYSKGASAGFYVSNGESTLGAFAKAEVAAWGTGGGGIQYELAPGENWYDPLTDTTVKNNALLGGAAAVGNFLTPGDALIGGRTPEKTFVDGTVWIEAAGTAQAGYGPLLSVGASTSTRIQTDQVYAITPDGYSTSYSISGEASADAGFSSNLPVLSSQEGGVAVEAHSSITFETVFDSEFNATELIVSTSVGADGDVTLGGQADDPLSITSQRWSLDLTDPANRQALADLTQTLQSQQITETISVEYLDLNPIADLLQRAETTGPVTQTLKETQYEFGIGAGIIGVGAEFEGSAGCSELS